MNTSLLASAYDDFTRQLKDDVVIFVKRHLEHKTFDLRILFSVIMAHLVCVGTVCMILGFDFCFVLWRPIFTIVLFVIVLWRELNCIKKTQCDVNKSANRLEIYAPKVEQYHLQSSCAHQILEHSLLTTFLHSTVPTKTPVQKLLYRFINSMQIIDQIIQLFFLVEDHGVTSLRPLHRLNCSQLSDCIALLRQTFTIFQ